MRFQSQRTRSSQRRAVPTREVAKRQRRPVTWCLNPDGRRDRDECTKPTIGRARNLSNGNVAVFSLVRFQEKEMRKAALGVVWDGLQMTPETICRDPEPA